jgi:hypothetical protein
MGQILYLAQLLQQVEVAVEAEIPTMVHQMELDNQVDQAVAVDILHCITQEGRHLQAVKEMLEEVAKMGFLMDLVAVVAVLEPQVKAGLLETLSKMVELV